MPSAWVVGAASTGKAALGAWAALFPPTTRDTCWAFAVEMDVLIASAEVRRVAAFFVALRSSPPPLAPRRQRPMQERNWSSIAARSRCWCRVAQAPPRHCGCGCAPPPPPPRARPPTRLPAVLRPEMAQLKWRGTPSSTQPMRRSRNRRRRRGWLPSSLASPT